MTVAEARKLMAVFWAIYPNYNPINTELAAQAWADATSEYTYKDVEKAFKIYAKNNTSGFAPNPGQIIEEIYRLSHAHEMNANQAWDFVIATIENNDSTRAVDLFEVLPNEIKRAIGGLNSFIEIKYMSKTERAKEKINFSKCYQYELEEQKRFEKLPENIKPMIKESPHAPRLETQKEEPEQDMSDDEWLEFMKNMTDEEYEKWRGDE